jgi:hypothetical protein
MSVFRAQGRRVQMMLRLLRPLPALVASNVSGDNEQYSALFSQGNAGDVWMSTTARTFCGGVRHRCLRRSGGTCDKRSRTPRRNRASAGSFELVTG